MFSAGFSRRRFLVYSGTAMAGSAALPGLAAASVARQAKHPVIAVCDHNHPLARRFGRVAMAAGAKTLVLSEDPMRMWLDQLYPTLEKESALVGMTSWNQFMVLRGQAEALGLRLRYQARHDVGCQGVQHRMATAGSKDTPAAHDCALFAADDQWVTALADVLLQPEGKPLSPVPLKRAEELPQPVQPTTLFSWRMA